MKNMANNISCMSEKSQYPYVFWQGPRLIVTMPVTGGERIGTDNTCKTAYALRKFWGKKHNSDNKKDSVFHVLNRMRADIKNDLSFLRFFKRLDCTLFTGMPQERVDELITVRAEKIKEIDRVFHHLTSHKDEADIQQLAHTFPDIPSKMMCALNAFDNARRLLLAPDHQDSYTRLGNYLFSVDRMGPQHLKTTLFSLNINGDQFPNRTVKQTAIDSIKADYTQQ